MEGDHGMTTPESALLLAGFVLAHAAWSVSDLPKGDLLCPVAAIEKDASRTLSRFEAPTQAEAISTGKLAMAEATKSADAWAFAREGLMPEGSTKIDVLVVDVWAKGMNAPIIVIQRFEPFAERGRFRIIGAPKIVIDGVIQAPEKVSDLVAGIERGISQHTCVKDLWNGWLSK
jgi:hypothetical protein